MSLKTPLVLLLITLFINSKSQSLSKGKNLDLVFNAAYSAYAELRGDLDITQLPDTLYSSLITIEGTNNNYIKRLASNTYGYFATLGEGLTLAQAKAIVKSWKAIVEGTIPKYKERGEKIAVMSFTGTGYLFLKTGDTTNMQIFVVYYKQENSIKYDAQLYCMYAKTTQD